jgi:hypothetical protein
MQVPENESSLNLKVLGTIISHRNPLDRTDLVAVGFFEINQFEINFFTNRLLSAAQYHNCAVQVNFNTVP